MVLLLIVDLARIWYSTSVYEYDRTSFCSVLCVSEAAGLDSLFYTSEAS